ncbi:TfpX/TfpZ family type IV pilin accessory protein [Undibacterium oligocarboniphilum]|uniref:Pilus assembly protein n=1 Tax=Undibacterium oligocarboniphilum TaxID=666702 RepID=A0A850QDD2_9BURK|nr:TfpX/TfpZ family type IV pilin accessory protein [Undibacterium oligocarboniphilum]MBC3870746.1 pilus assembly protein [Undibacterium oligocarboniphilum]NVO78452.1 pilus assembly protein [Undibacterium oligocarboniphilum]
MSEFQIRIKAALIHLLVSALVVSLVAGLVLLLWYPWPYSRMAGGLNLLILVATVDLFLGPMLTLVIFDSRKSRSVLFKDILVIGCVQLAGLLYGTHTVYLARPVALVFEGSRFRVVSAAGVQEKDLSQASPDFRSLSMTGPRLTGTRPFRSQQEKMEAADKALAGVDIGLRPIFWQDYSLSVPQVLSSGKPVELLYQKYPADQELIDERIKATGRPKSQLKFIPLIAREGGGDWLVLIDAISAQPVGFIEKDGFF